MRRASARADSPAHLTGTTLGGFIYVLLVVAIVLVLVRIISGRRPV